MTEQTKWKTGTGVATDTIFDENGRRIAECVTNIRGVDEANAQKIIHAVNNFEEMKSLLQNFISDHDTYKGIVPTYVIRFSLDASELLRRIEEGK